jgi:hypothetical protein
MITGDLRPWAGSSIDHGFDGLKQRPEVFQLIGYYPQIDALFDDSSIAFLDEPTNERNGLIIERISLECHSTLSERRQISQSHITQVSQIKDVPSPLHLDLSNNTKQGRGG